MGQPVNPVWVSGHYRFEDDDGTLDGSTFLAAEDTTITQDVDSNFRLRINWGESAGQNQDDNLTAQLQFRINAGTWTTVGAATEIQYASSGNETDGNTSATERLGTPPTGAATYVETEFDSNNTTTDNIPIDQYYELSFNLLIDSAQVANNDTIDFQLIDGNAVETFSTTDTVPTLTVNEAVVPTNYERTLTSEVDAQDQQQAYENKLRHLLSTLDVADNISSVVSVPPILRVLSSNLNVSDEIRATSLRYVNLASQLNIQDSSVVGALLARALLSSLDVDDVLVRTTTTVGEVVERFLSSELEINDALVNEVLAERLLTDNVELFDLIIRIVSQAQVVHDRSLISAIDVNDSLSRDALLVRLLFSSINANDTTQIEKLLYRKLNDNAELTDAIVSLIQGLIVTRVLSSEVNVIDSITLIANLTRQLIEPVDINDVIVEGALLYRLLGDVTDVIDFIQSGVFTVLERVLGSSIDLDDAALLQRELSRSALSSLLVVDNLIREQNLSRLLVDNPDILDAIIRTITLPPQGFVRILSDNIDLQDAILTQVANLLRGYILMNIEGSPIITDTKTSDIIIDTRE